MTTQTLQSEVLFRAPSSCKSEQGTNKTNKTLTSCKRGKSTAFEYCLKRNRQLQHTLCWVRPLNTKRVSSNAQQSYCKFGVEEARLPVPCVVSLCSFFCNCFRTSDGDRPPFDLPRFTLRLQVHLQVTRAEATEAARDWFGSDALSAS